MAYIGNQSATAFTSFDKQIITGNGGTTYTLSHAVANEQEIEVFVNNVRQEGGSGKAFTVSGNQITFTGAVASSDSCYVNFQGKAIQTVVPPDGSVTDAKITAMAASKLTGALPALDGSALTGTGVIKYFGTSELSQNKSQTTTSTTYVSTGATITIPAATVATLSKIVVFANGSMRVDKNSHSFIDVRIQRTAPSAVNFAAVIGGDTAGGLESYPNTSVVAIDSSLGTGDHTYTVYVRKSTGNPTYAGTIYYNYEGHRMIAAGV